MFLWRFVGPGDVATGSSEPFANRDAAEAWLGAGWAELHDRGVEEVELIDVRTDEVLYRMSLAVE